MKSRLLKVFKPPQERSIPNETQGFTIDKWKKSIIQTSCQNSIEYETYSELTGVDRDYSPTPRLIAQFWVASSAMARAPLAMTMFLRN